MEDRHAPPAIAPVWDLVPLPPALVVEEGFGDDLVPEVITPRLVLGGEVVLESATVGGLVGVASGSLPAACASATLNPGACPQSVTYVRDRLSGYLDLRYHLNMPSVEQMR